MKSNTRGKPTHRTHQLETHTSLGNTQAKMNANTRVKPSKGVH